MTFSELINYFVSLLVICNPASGLTVLLSLSKGRTIKEKKATAISTGFAIIVILVLMTLSGPYLLEILGIRLAAFQIAGGVVLFLLALSMLRAEQTPMRQNEEDQQEAVRKDSIAVVPLAIPVIAGPGAISTVIATVSSSKIHGMDVFFLSIIGVLVGVLIGGFLYFAGPLEKMLGNTGINLVNRIGGLIVAAMAIDILAKGCVGVFPGLCPG